MHLTPILLPPVRSSLGEGQIHNFATPAPLRGTSKMGEGAGGEVKTSLGEGRIQNFATPSPEASGEGSGGEGIKRVR